MSRLRRLPISPLLRVWRRAPDVQVPFWVRDDVVFGDLVDEHFEYFLPQALPRVLKEVSLDCVGLTVVDDANRYVAFEPTIAREPEVDGRIGHTREVEAWPSNHPAGTIAKRDGLNFWVIWSEIRRGLACLKVGQSKVLRATDNLMTSIRTSTKKCTDDFSYCEEWGIFFGER